MASCNFNDSLMETVRKYPAIYDKTDKSYKDRNAKSNAWDQIAKAVDSDVTSVIKRYNTIRTKLSKYLGKLKLPSGSGAVAAVKPEFESLRWLITHIDHRPTTSNYKHVPHTSDEEYEDDDEEEPEMTNCEPQSRSKVKVQSRSAEKKRKRSVDSAEAVDMMLLEHLKKDNATPTRLFCLSLVPKLDALSEDQREIAQIEILHLLRRIRLGSSISSPPPASQTSHIPLPATPPSSAPASNPSISPANYLTHFMPYNFSQHLQ